MPEDIGHFKVIIEGEIDKKLGDSLEKGLKESSEKVSKNLEKEIDSGINLGTRKGIEKFEKNIKIFETKLKTLIKSPSFTNLFAFIDTTTEKSSTSTVPKPQEDTGKDVAEGAAEGAAAGGIKGAAIGAIVSILAKISVGIMALQAVMSLGPVQGMLKMITAILQITLYPITNFFLAIFKPILIMLLKYLILPFYYNVMPVLEKLGSFFGAVLTGDWTAAGEIGKELLDKFDIWLKNLPSVIWPTVVDWCDRFDAWLRSLPGIVWPTVVDWCDKFDAWLRSLPGIVWPAIVDLLDKFDAWLRSQSGMDFPDSPTLLDKFDTWLRSLPGIIWPATTDLLDKFDDWLRSLPGIVWPATTDLLDKFDKWLRSQLDMDFPDSPTLLDKFDTWLRSLPGIIWPATVDLLDKFDAWLRSFNPFNKDKNEDKNDCSSYKPGCDSSGCDSSGCDSSGCDTIQCYTGGCSPYSPSCGNDTKCLTDGLGNCDYTGMATGGIVTKPTRALIGESGPEAVIPLPGFLSSGSSLGDLVRGNGSVNTKLQNVGGNTINVNFNIARVEKEVDINDLVEKIERAFYTNSKRAGIR